MHIAHVTRRSFLGTAAASLAIPITRAQAAPKYKRCLVTSPEGKTALASYAKGIQAMLKLPPDHPQNWFRNAFIHLMDCPHGNWWFYVWHRGYLGFFEETIRSLSGDKDFALPYWDWTALPQIPDSMFDGVLTPTDAAYEPFTKTLDTFTAYFKPAITTYWNSLATAQRHQLELRGYASLCELWADVTGAGVSANESFAATAGSRFLSPQNPQLDADTAPAVSAHTVGIGLTPKVFNEANASKSFTSSKASSHNVAPANGNVFSTLEGQPHNLVHNCIGGADSIPPPWGNMTNFLSPVDPIFFLHHANMDRLWDVWTRKQMAAGRPYLPQGQDLATYSKEPFLFFVDGKGQFVRNGKAGDYLSMARFDYDYDRLGFGEDLVEAKVASRSAGAPSRSVARISGDAATIALPEASARGAAAEDAAPVAAQVTIVRPKDPNVRQFRVFVGAPADAKDLGPDSPFYAGTVGFFGAPMAGMDMAHEATFSLPLPPKLLARRAASATADHAATDRATASRAEVPVQVVPTGGGVKAPVLKGFTIEAL